jgi:hypothetical protein
VEGAGAAAFRYWVALLENGSLIGAAELAWQPVLGDPALLDA